MSYLQISRVYVMDSLACLVLLKVRDKIVIVGVKFTFFFSIKARLGL